MCFQNYEIDISLGVFLRCLPTWGRGEQRLDLVKRCGIERREKEKKWRGTGTSTGGRRVLRLRVRHSAERTRVGGKFLPETSVADPDPYISGPSGSGSISQRYGSLSFYHQAKIVRKILIPTVFVL